MFEAGWWIPHRSLKLHWSLPVSLVLAGLYGGSALVAAGTAGLLVLHGLGHLALLRRVGGRLGALELHGLGGDAVPAGSLSKKHRSVVAWGGVLAQLLVYGLTRLLTRGELALPEPLLLVLTDLNLLLLFLNLIPLFPFDGEEAWRLPSRLQDRYQGYGRRQVAIVRALAEEERRRQEDPLLHELRAALRGAPEPAGPRKETEAAALSSFEEAIQAEELPVDPSYELPDDEIPDTLVRELGDLIAGILRGEDEG
ncbi:MAG: hypothetical protein H6740_12160 [Alphaproteobacteria bacterium]|nr:hypothetical protein [Alphaproteobacteria bacterium]